MELLFRDKEEVLLRVVRTETIPEKLFDFLVEEGIRIGKHGLYISHNEQNYMLAITLRSRIGNGYKRTEIREVIQLNPPSIRKEQNE